MSLLASMIVLCPSTERDLGDGIGPTREPYPDARRVIDAGVTVAIASNCNPGSNYTTSISFCVAISVRDMHLTIDEASRPSPSAVQPRCAAHHHLAYRPGMPLIRQTIGPVASRQHVRVASGSVVEPAID